MAELAKYSHQVCRSSSPFQHIILMETVDILDNINSQEIETVKERSSLLVDAVLALALTRSQSAAPEPWCTFTNSSSQHRSLFFEHLEKVCLFNIQNSHSHPKDSRPQNAFKYRLRSLDSKLPLAVMYMKKRCRAVITCSAADSESVLEAVQSSTLAVVLVVVVASSLLLLLRHRHRSFATERPVDFVYLVGTYRSGRQSSRSALAMRQVSHTHILMFLAQRDDWHPTECEPLP